jgi:hypothetical protein
VNKKGRFEKAERRVKADSAQYLNNYMNEPTEYPFELQLMIEKEQKILADEQASLDAGELDSRAIKRAKFWREQDEAIYRIILMVRKMKTLVRDVVMPKLEVA